jgi:perosamine synthetase
MSRTIQLDAPSVGEREKEFLCRAIDSGFVSTVGPLIGEFETRFADYMGSAQAVSVQSGTAALHVALHELGIGPGDEVIVPALTFIASVNPVMYVGATPVIVDVDRDTWNLDPLKLEEAITAKTRAIIPVHLFGNPCNMDAIMGIARKYALAVIEDATESLGATFRGKQTGTFGELGCFSFNGNKTITTGGGGMVVGYDEGRMRHIRFLVNQGRDESPDYFHPEIGFNYRMTNIEAALGLAQMERLDNFLQVREEFFDLYSSGLGTLKSVRLQAEYGHASSSRWLTCATIAEDADLSSLMAALHGRGIQTRRVFKPINEQPYYAKFARQECPVAREIHRHGICLPSSTLNDVGDITRVCTTIKELMT